MAQSNELEELIINNEFDFDLENYNGSYGGSVYNKYDTWECDFGRDFFILALILEKYIMIG